MNYEESIAYLNSIVSRGVKPGQERVNKVLDLLGSPQSDYAVILVGGTNGKGSVSTFLSSILTSSGLKTGLHTKPHIIGPEERIAINNCLIDRKLFAKYLGKIRDVCDDKSIKITYFEILAVLAIYSFAMEKVDIAVVEVGLGGRLDATNALEPVLSVVTNVASDHADRLGSDLVEVARDKAGIARKNQPFITNSASIELTEALFEEAEKTGALCFHVSNIVKMTEKDDKLLFSFPDCRKLEVSLSMKGSFQKENALTAVGAVVKLRESGVLISDEAIKEGLERAFIPGRFEIVGTRPLLIADGAHNAPAALVLKENISALKNTKKVLVMAIMKDKDVKAYLQTMKNTFNTHIFVAVNYFRSLEAEVLEKEALKVGYENTIVAKTLKEAISKAFSLAGKDGMVCVTGSLYLVGELKQLLRD